MILNCSNKENEKRFVNIKLFSIISILFALQGCINYQPPAPVYGKPISTNPYEVQPAVNTFPLQTEQIKKLQKATSSAISNQAQVHVAPAKKPLTPAVLALISEADQNTKAGDLESAVATIERALRIDPRNPSLIYKLASIRLKQSKPRLAEDLAKKAALLSVNDKRLKKKSWLLISEARKRQKNHYGAKEAKLKASRI